jgi:hypothetical protein
MAGKIAKARKAAVDAYERTADAYKKTAPARKELGRIAKSASSAAAKAGARAAAAVVAAEVARKLNEPAVKAKRTKRAKIAGAVVGATALTVAGVAMARSRRKK